MTLLPRRAVLAVLGPYQQYRALQPAACRYLPTCSAYALEAVQIHGAVRGLWLAMRRVARCHPLGSHGHDPVPALKGSAELPMHESAGGGHV